MVCSPRSAWVLVLQNSLISICHFDSWFKKFLELPRLVEDILLLGLIRSDELATTKFTTSISFAIYFSRSLLAQHRNSHGLTTNTMARVAPWDVANLGNSDVGEARRQTSGLDKASGTADR